jgi:hypothetical protein
MLLVKKPKVRDTLEDDLKLNRFSIFLNKYSLNRKSYLSLTTAILIKGVKKVIFLQINMNGFSDEKLF